MLLLEIKDLHVAVGGKEIIRGLNLRVNTGETHAVMGPNGTGKSTLALAIAGREGYEVTSGEILYKGMNILEMSPDKRALEGIFLVLVMGIIVYMFSYVINSRLRKLERLITETEYRIKDESKQD